MVYALVLCPLAFALAAFLIPKDRARPWMVTAGGVVHSALVALALRGEPTAPGGWLSLDPLGKLVLALTSAIFLVCSLYAPAYLRQRADRPNRVFCACLLAFLSMMSLIAESHHLGLMWVAAEAATLSTAPLLYFNRNQRSLEATWKYLLIGSVGVALAL